MEGQEPIPAVLAKVAGVKAEAMAAVAVAAAGMVAAAVRWMPVVAVRAMCRLREIQTRK